MPYGKSALAVQVLKYSPHSAMRALFHASSIERVKVNSDQFYFVPRGRHEAPRAVLTTGVVVGPVGAAHFPYWLRDVMLAAACSRHTAFMATTDFKLNITV